MRIAIDLMGGDNAPDAVVKGICMALEQGIESELLVFGSEDALKGFSGLPESLSKKLTLIPTTEVVEGNDHPTVVIRTKKDSSLFRAIDAVANGEADCVVSAGNTGALLAGATLIIRRINGILRPALITVIPTVKDTPVLLLDSGANTDCKPEYLKQFAQMGSLYYSCFLNNPEPAVGLLNNGAESEKGNVLAKAAHELLENSGLNFAGNCEARDVLSGTYQVVVADGFDGNILLKSIEGTVSAVFTLLKQSLYSSFITKLGALLAKPAFRSLKKKFSYSETGGAALIGVRGGVIKAHGSSDATAFMNAIFQAERFISLRFIDKLKETFEEKS